MSIELEANCVGVAQEGDTLVVGFADLAACGGWRVTDGSILWRRLDQAGHEAARLVAQPPGWHLTRTAVFVSDG